MLVLTFFNNFAQGKAPSLKKLARECLSIDIQQDHHDSVRVLRIRMSAQFCSTPPSSFCLKNFSMIIFYLICSTYYHRLSDFAPLQIEDARVAMRLYQLHKREWEAMVKARRRRKGQ